MTAPAEGWWHDPATLRKRVEEEGTFSALARKTGVPANTLKSARDRHAAAGLWPEKLTEEVEADRLSDIEGLLRDRGLALEDWLVDGVTVNEWGSADSLQRQLKVRLRRKLGGDLLAPATVTPLVFPKAKKRQERATRLIFIYGDDQRPGHDPDFEALKLRWVEENQPDQIVDLGDGMDFPRVSGHKPNPARHWTVQECVNSYASWLYSLRLAAPHASVTVLADNHVTQRLRDYQLARAADLYGVTPAQVEGMADDLEPLLSIRRLLRLDELGVTYLDPPAGDHYAESHLELIPEELVAIHGYRTGAGLGKKFIDDYGCSVVYGHQHGQDVYVTDSKRRGVGRRKRLYGLGVGCGMVLQGGGGFAPGADWQNCALTVSVFPDGGWTFDYMDYAHGVLRWRDQSYAIERKAA